MAHYPSGITPLPGADATDVRARLAQMVPAIDEHPIGATTPCANPECAGPVDYLGHGRPPLYCSATCRSRVATLRRVATEQLDLIERTLDDARSMRGVPRDRLQARANQLRWWLEHLHVHAGG